MPQFAAEQIYAFARRAGFDPDAAATMTAIALAESGGDSRAHQTSGEDSRGLWQIDVLARPDLGARHDLFDPVANARAAYELSGGGTALGSWQSSRAEPTARYLRFRPEAEAAARAYGDGSGRGTWDAAPPAAAAPAGPTPMPPTPAVPVPAAPVARGSRHVLVAGGPGSGRTSLADELRRSPGEDADLIPFEGPPIGEGRDAALVRAASVADAVLATFDGARPPEPDEAGLIRLLRERCPLVIAAVTRTDLYAHWPATVDACRELLGAGVEVLPVSVRLPDAESGLPALTRQLCAVAHRPPGETGDREDALDRELADLTRMAADRIENADPVSDWPDLMAWLSHETATRFGALRPPFPVPREAVPALLQRLLGPDSGPAFPVTAGVPGPLPGPMGTARLRRIGTAAAERYLTGQHAAVAALACS